MDIYFYYNILSQPCRVVLMVFRELGIAFKPVLIDFATNDLKSKWFLELNARGQIPVIKDGDFVLGESRAIILYLAREYGKKSLNPQLYPNDKNIRGRIDEMILLDAELFVRMSYYVNNKEVWHGNGEPKIENRSQALYGLHVYEGILKTRPFIAADHLTIADFAALSTITTIENVGFDDWETFPFISDWRKRMEALTQYKECWHEPHLQSLEMFHAKVQKNKQFTSKI